MKEGDMVTSKVIQFPRTKDTKDPLHFSGMGIKIDDLGLNLHGSADGASILQS
jgi:hypothetical protein